MSNDVQLRFETADDFQSVVFGVNDTACSEENMERGHKFDELRTSGAFSKTGLESVADTLMENMIQVTALAHMPIDVFNYGRRFQEVYATFVVEPARTSVEGMSEDVVRHFQAQEETRKWILGLKQHESTIGPVTSGMDVAGFAVVNSHPSLEDFKQRQLQGFGLSIVVNAWAMFESLSEDLWKAAINHQPAILKSVGNKVTISFDALNSRGFDASKSLGDFVADNYNFRSLKKITESYEKVFSKGAPYTPISSVLSAPGLKHAAAVRNLFMHKRGILDEEWNSQTAEIKDAPKWVPGPPLKMHLTLKLCAELHENCRTSCIGLVNAVHEWIIRFQTRGKKS